MQKNRNNFIILFIYGGALLLMTIVQATIIVSFPEIWDDDELFITFSTISNLVLYGSLFILFIYIFRNYFKSQIKHFLDNKKQVITVITIGILAMYAMSIISNIILTLLGITETSENQEQLIQLLNGSMFDKVSLFIFAVIFAPLVEEFVFRKAIIDLVNFKIGTDDGSKRYKRNKILIATFSVLVSGALFGFIHVTSGDYIQMIYYGFLGVTLGVIYLASDKNILAAILVHFMMNLFATLLLFM